MHLPVPPSSEPPLPPRLSERLFLASTHQEALVTLARGLVGPTSLISVTGEAGTGKTTVVRAGLEANGVVAVWFSGRGLDGTAMDALRAALFGTSAVPRRDTGPIIVVDDAHDLPPGVLEELSSAWDRGQGVGVGDGAPKLILIGRPELWPRLRGPDLSDQSGRSELRTVLFPMSYPEAERYVDHMLRRAGTSTRKIMSPKALHEILLRSRGNPRRINAELEKLLVMRVRATHQSHGVQPPPQQLGRGKLLDRYRNARETALAAVMRTVPTFNVVGTGLPTPQIAEIIRDGEARRDAGPSPRYRAKQPRWRRKLARTARSRLVLLIGATAAVLAVLVAVLPTAEDARDTAVMPPRSPPRIQETRAAPARATYGFLGGNAQDRASNLCAGGRPCATATRSDEVAGPASREPGAP